MELSAVYTDNGKTVSLTPEAYECTKRAVVTCNRRMREQISVLEGTAPTETRVIIFGEPGTQKQRYAEYVHELSRRRSGPYMRFDCAATPVYQCEDALFGSCRGGGFDRWEQKGLLEVAAGGTLLLDEISAMPEFLYGKIERLLEEGTISRRGSRECIRTDVRLLATCSRDLAKLMSRNSGAEFIQKLASIHIHITPLRKRPEDIALLTLHYLHNANIRNGTGKAMGSALFREILAYSWPGNERELKNFVEQMVMVTEKDVLNDPRMLRSVVQLNRTAVSKETGVREEKDVEEKSLKELVSEYEMMLIHQSIRKHGSLRKAAKALQIAPSALSRKLAAEKIEE